VLIVDLEIREASLNRATGEEQIERACAVLTGGSRDP
jgi:hypothetical protein